MSVSLNFNAALHQTVISVRGPFTQEIRSEFFKAITAVPDSVVELVIDLSETMELDASAMGMLIMLRDRYPDSDSIILLAPKSPIEQLLRTANFHQLFAFEIAV